MLLEQMHPEDVKAVIRKRYGTISRFVAAHDLPRTGVSDLFRGRTSQRVSDAVESVLAEDAAAQPAGRGKAVAA
jgi:hypothetical protein